MASPQYWALIPAAGIGSRMAAELPKQYLPLDQHCVLEHTLKCFLELDWVSGVMVVLSAEDQRFEGLPVANHAKIFTTTGGASRADSVLAGLQAIEAAAGDDVHVMVHDAARPGVDIHLLERLKAEYDPVNGALLALPVADTLKREHAHHTPAASDGTLDRSGLWQAQTPQMFGLAALMQALTQAIQSGAAITDDASAMEAAGHRPRLVLGSPRNFKITLPADLQMARHLLAPKNKADS